MSTVDATYMEIIWLGHSSFRIKGKGATVVTDPYGDGIGIKFPKQEADIVTISHGHDDHNQAAGVGGNPFLIDTAGEYEVKGVSVFGVPTFHDNEGGVHRGRNTVFVIEVDGVKVCHLGDLGHKLTDGQVEEINSIDVLLVPVGGVFTLDPKGAAAVVSQLEPKFVVPMHYKFEGLDNKMFGELAEVEAFLKEIGVEKNLQPRLSLVAERLSEEEMSVVVLERKS